MKSLFEKTADALGLFSPIILMLFICSSYLGHPSEEEMKIDEEVKKEIKTETIKDGEKSLLHDNIMFKHFLLSRIYDPYS